MSKRGFKRTSSVTLRLFPGAKPEETSFDVVKVTGNPSNIDIESLVDNPDSVRITSAENSNKECGEYETFDGYFPEDGYDYTQHLREINQERFVPNGRKVTEEKVDLNRELAEVMEAMLTGDSEAFDEIDTSFVKKLGPLDERTRLAMLWGEDQADDYLSMPTEKLMAINERIKEMEQSAAKREGDEEFDEFFAREFEDSKIGGLSAEDVEVGEIDDEEEAGDTREDDDPERIRMECMEETRRLVASNLSLQQSVLDQQDDMTDVMLVPAKRAPEWDCESVLSSRSNLFNHPGLIARPRRERKERVPAVIEEEASDVYTPVRTVSTLRKADETAEERKERKKAIKEFQKEQRLLKKSAKAEMAEQVNKQKHLLAVSKHSNYGDIPDGVPKFRV